MQLVAPILNILVQQIAPSMTTRKKCGRFFSCFYLCWRALAKDYQKRINLIFLIILEQLVLRNLL
ncbi:hypothetical protein FXB85_01975 [Aggregatibacter actinomycetemcomitans]|nr:hypothetical protein FXB85_01975 [Aggregatibacter actinomycetemcomitans]